jgi:hypothetical protein
MADEPTPDFFEFTGWIITLLLLGFVISWLVLTALKLVLEPEPDPQPRILQSDTKIALAEICEGFTFIYYLRVLSGLKARCCLLGAGHAGIKRGWFYTAFGP